MQASKGNSKTTLKPWKKLNTADYFVYSTSKKIQDVNKIRFENYILEPAHTGNAYAGLRFWPKIIMNFCK